MHPVEKLIRVAHKIFSSNGSKPSIHSQEDCRTKLAALQPLVDAMADCNATNLNLLESMKGLRKPIRAPVTHMDMCENELFTIGVFILHPGSRVPLHDHPGMLGVLRVIHGEILIKSYTAISTVLEDRFKAIEEKPILVSSASLPTILTPRMNNYHEIEFVRGEGGNDFAAFLDILSPPYYSIADSSPECKYYQVIRQPEKDTLDGKSVVQLLTCSCPQEYFNNSVPYRGPELESILREHGNYDGEKK